MDTYYNQDENWIEIYKLQENAAFFGIFYEIRANFIKTRENRDEIWKDCKLLGISKIENAHKNWRTAELLMKYWGLSGAKTCKLCRSRQELSDEYLLAKFGFDTAENEPL